MRFLLSSLCFLGSLCFLCAAAGIAFGDSLYDWYWKVPTGLEANSSGPLRVGVSEAEQSPRAAAQSGVASQQFLPGTQALPLNNSPAEAGANFERPANKVEAPPPSPEYPAGANATVQLRVVSELFEKVEGPALPNSEARSPATSAALSKREELPLTRAEATPPDDASSKQSASQVEELPAPQIAAASPPNAMAPESASSERVTSEEPISTRPPAVPSEAGRRGLAATEAAAYIAQAQAKIQQGDIAAARRLLERASDSGEGEAWFPLAETYDPQMLARWGVVGIKPDLEKAKALYQEAQSRGAQGARKRLLALRQ
jgi:hypothetical protein